MKTAIFGGSFNPVHNGHINLVREVIRIERLDRVIIMPAFISPFKKNECPLPADGIHRLEMLRLAFKGMKDIFVSDYELKRAEVSYTVNTLKHFRETYPDDELYFIMGGDMLSSLHMWYKFDEIMSLCGIIAAARTESEKDYAVLQETAEKLRKYGDVKVIPVTPFEISSTFIREMIGKNSDISCYLPGNVLEYIKTYGLYLNYSALS